ncbi:MAG: hypothetical protein ABIS01_16755 [Ferruginibacter sp.]
MTLLLQLFLNILLIGLFLFSKLLPYRDRLNPQYKGVFNFFSSIFTPLLNGLKTIIKPFVIGLNLSLDMTQLVLFIGLLLLMQIF